MALPTTQKECTTRRIAALISGLWDKVKNAFLLKTSRGAANGVASLDANGKVPTSQLPTVPTGNLPANSSSSAGIVASGSGQNYQVWMTDATGVPAWRNQCFVPELEINETTNKSRLLYTIQFQTVSQWPGCSFMISAGDSGNVYTGLYRLDVRCNEYNITPKVFRLYTVLPGSSSSLPEMTKMYYKYDTTNSRAYIYATVGGYNVFKMTPIYMSDNNMVSYSNTDVTIPEDAIQINSIGCMLVSKPTGSASVPVYVNSNGAVTPCNSVIAISLQTSTINKEGQTTKIWKKIATSRVFTTYAKASITFLICGDGYNEVLGFESIVTVSIRTGGGGRFYSAYVGKYNFRSFCTVELLRIGNTNQYEIWVKAPLTDTGVQLVHLNSQGMWTIETNTSQDPQKTDSEYSTYKSSNPSVASSYYHTYNIAKSATSQIGDPSTPVYVNSTGEIVACTNVPIIEHVTSIPVNPTVGTIYAL